MQTHWRAMLLLAGLAFFVLPYAAADADRPAHVAGERLRLVAASDMSSGVFLVGLDMQMQPGWHTYWRKAGDSGIAPRFDWSKSENLGEIKLLWPVPERFDRPDDMTIGYENRIVWPVLVKPADPSRPVILHLQMHYGVCSDICVPGEDNLNLTLPADVSEEDSALVHHYLVRVPKAPESEDAVSVQMLGDDLLVTLQEEGIAPALIVEGPKGIWFGQPVVKRDGGALLYKVPVERTGDALLKGKDVTLTFSAEATAIEAMRKIN